MPGDRCLGYPIEHRVYYTTSRGKAYGGRSISLCRMLCFRPSSSYEILSLYASLFFLQDALLKQLVSNAEQLGTSLRWDIIASRFPDRSDVQCQQRWAKVVNPELVKGPWTKEVGNLKNISGIYHSLQ